MSNLDDVKAVGREQLRTASTFGKEQLDAASTTAASLAKSFQTIAAETADYSRRSLEANTSHMEKLLQSRSLDDTIRIQSEYAKSAYQTFLSHMSRIGELYSSLAVATFKPIEATISKVQATTDQVRASADRVKGYAAGRS